MRSSGFIERSLAGLGSALGAGETAEEIAAGGGWMQGVDARVKCAGLLGWIIVGVASKRWEVTAVLLALGAVLSLGSTISWRQLVLREWVPVGMFAAMIGVPALAMVPGEKWFAMGPVVVTVAGARSAGVLLLRAEMSATLALLLALSTTWPKLLRALRSLGVPAVFTALLAMTQRYIFLFLETAADMFMARRARVVGKLPRTEARRVATATAGVLLDKSLGLSEEVAWAMQARGFRGDFPSLEAGRLGRRDWAVGVGFLVVGALGLFVGLR